MICLSCAEYSNPAHSVNLYESINDEITSVKPTFLLLGTEVTKNDHKSGSQVSTPDCRSFLFG
jgi:hypothetical protein